MTKHDFLALLLPLLLLFLLVQFQTDTVNEHARNPDLSQAAVSGVGGPFGGAITDIFICVNGLKVTVGPPIGGIFMYIPGTSFSYAFGPPQRVGQWLLGMSRNSEPCLVPCESGLCPYGFGNVIIFHGSSR